MRFLSVLVCIHAHLLTCGGALLGAESTAPIAPDHHVFDEANGVIAVEAEHFCEQTLSDTRAWHITSSQSMPALEPDPDPAHLEGASGGAYVEILPDSRATHAHKLIEGENFSPQPGKLAVAHYKVNFKQPGRYYVWIRSFSTGTEDNGVHVGLDGQWPESGQRWQTTQKRKWSWDCRQRTAEQHSGVPMQLFLDVAAAGHHELLLSMREDGIEIDKIVLARDEQFKPTGMGPEAELVVSNSPEALGSNAAASGDSRLTPNRGSDGDGKVHLSGELKQWHKVTMTLNGPFADELDSDPNPFTDYNFTVTFTHESGTPSYLVPGYFAADGDAAETSASSGHKWRAHLSPDKQGTWSYKVSFTQGANVAVDDTAEASAVASYDGQQGTFAIAATDKAGRDFRSKGRLTYVGKPYLQFAGSKEYFLKAGADAPENFLAYRDFDGDFKSDGHKDGLVKDWTPHLQDWKTGDPTWQDGKGKGMIGALNYLAGKGANAVSFLTLNILGDDRNVFPYVNYDDYVHFDVSRLAQWEIVFNHAQQVGLFLHFKTQEAENQGLLDGGNVGPERKLYYRELMARFGHHLALNWNMGEEIGPWQKHEKTPAQRTPQRLAMAQYFHEHDPYGHHVVIHNGQMFDDLIGPDSAYTGVSLQTGFDHVHRGVLNWVNQSKEAGKPWAVANDEQNPAGMGVPPDAGFEGHSGEAITKDGNSTYTLHDVRKTTLWGALMAGGWGVEYYFGYQLPETDLSCQNYRSRDESWDYCRIALEFFHANQVPFWEMSNADPLVGNPKSDNSKYCLAKPGEFYLVYLPDGGSTSLDLRETRGNFTVEWFNPRTGGEPQKGNPTQVQGGRKVQLGSPPTDSSEDWVIIVRK